SKDVYLATHARTTIHEQSQIWWKREDVSGVENDTEEETPMKRKLAMCENARIINLASNDLDVRESYVEMYRKSGTSFKFSRIPQTQQIDNKTTSTFYIE
ncbi:Hypothetical protein FKW44_016541, partial [Caligus rogercresseyi]